MFVKFPHSTLSCGKMPERMFLPVRKESKVTTMVEWWGGGGGAGGWGKGGEG